MARTLLDAGCAVTAANRDTREAMPDVASVPCDRSVPGAIDVLHGRKFDAVIDLGFDQQDFDLKNLTFPFPHFNFYVCSDKLRQSTDFQASYSLPQMLQVYVDSWIRRGDLAPMVYAREQAALRRLEDAERGSPASR